MRISELPATLRRRLLGDKPSIPKANEGEDLFRFQIKTMKLPHCKEQFKFAPNREYRADFCFVDFKIICEINGGIFRVGGGAHSRPKKIVHDMRRQRIAVLHGYFLLPFTPDEVRQGIAINETQEILHQHGWRSV